MQDWLLQTLLGIHLPAGTHLVRLSPALRGSTDGWLLALIAIISCCLVGWLYYVATRQLGWVRRITLFFLRACFLLLVILAFKRPVAQITLEGSIRRSLLVLVDGTKSMTIPEERTEDADIKRAAIAAGSLDPKLGLDQPIDSGTANAASRLTRLSIIQAVLRNPKLDLLQKLGSDFEVRGFRFGQTDAADALLHDADLRSVNSLTADASTTAIGDSIHDAMARTRGQPLAGIWLITDGQNNAGTSMAAAAEDARQAGVPLFTYGVGLKLPRDVIVYKPFAPDIAFVNDEVPVTVRVRSQGLAGQSGRLSLSLGKQEVDHASVNFGADDQTVVPVRFIPDKPGDYELSAEIPPRTDEAVATNNRGVTHVRVVDGKIKVLYIEQSPRWEFKYLQALLLRDRRVSLKCVLLQGDPGITKGANTPYLAKIPSDREALLNYDLIILGDVDPHRLDPDLLSTFNDFVSKFGGGLISIAGHRFNPQAYAGSILQNMLPIEITDEQPISDHDGDSPISIQITDAGKQNPMLRLSDNLQESDRLWKDKIPPIYWDARVAGPKPAAEVLAVDPDSIKESRLGKMPVIAIQQYGVGQVLYVGTDNLWRWRRNLGEQYYQTFWSQAVQRLALPHLLGGSKRVQLRADKDSLSTGDRLTVDARLYDRSFLPVTDATLNGVLISDAGERIQIELQPVADQPGNFRAQFVAPQPGHYRFFIERAVDSETQKTQIDVTVTEPRQELEETAMNEAGLRETASISGGQFFREEDLYRLPDVVRARTERVQSTVDAEIWSSPAYFSVLMFLVIVEWILRKLFQMK